MKNTKHILFAWSIYTSELSHDEAVADINRALSYASVAGAGLLDRAGDIDKDTFIGYLHTQLGSVQFLVGQKTRGGANVRKGLDKFYTANIVQSDSGGYRTIAFLTPKSDVDFLIAYGVTCAPLPEVGQLSRETLGQVETRLKEAEQSDRHGKEPFDRLFETVGAGSYIEHLADDGGTNEGGGGKAFRSDVELNYEDNKRFEKMKKYIQDGEIEKEAYNGFVKETRHFKKVVDQQLRKQLSKKEERSKTIPYRTYIIGVTVYEGNRYYWVQSQQKNRKPYWLLKTK